MKTRFCSLGREGRNIGRRWLGFAAVGLLAGSAIVGCRPKSSKADDGATAVAQFVPNPPGVGKSSVTIVLTDGDGQPTRLGALKVEANMNHAGMSPVFATLAEASPGRYTGSIQFTMGGDWFLLLSGARPDGTFFEKKVDVRGVRGGM